MRWRPSRSPEDAAVWLGRSPQVAFRTVAQPTQLSPGGDCRPTPFLGGDVHVLSASAPSGGRLCSSTTPERSPYSHVFNSSASRAPASRARANAASTSGKLHAPSRCASHRRRLAQPDRHPHRPRRQHHLSRRATERGAHHRSAHVPRTQTPIRATRPPRGDAWMDGIGSHRGRRRRTIDQHGGQPDGQPHVVWNPDAGPVERTRPEQGLSDDEHGHDRGVERRERVTKESNPVQHCVIDALCCRLVELLVVAAKHCPVERTWIEACQVTLTVI